LVLLVVENLTTKDTKTTKRNLSVHSEITLVRLVVKKKDLTTKNTKQPQRSQRKHKDNKEKP